MQTKYILELCDTSGQHKPVARFVSSTPFMQVSIGERFDDIGWDRLDGIGKIASSASPKRYTVHSIKHLVLMEREQLVVKYCLNLEPFIGISSPVWGNE
jgi:hypothetical protein